MDRRYEEYTIDQLQEAMGKGELTSAALTAYYLGRIAEIDRGGPGLNAVAYVNPHALQIAEAMDRERTSVGTRGPLHGIPILIKANIDTRDHMPTSAGSLALEHSYAPKDAYLVSKLREAGAVLLGKANLTELANFMTEGMPSGYSSLGGQVRNPYQLDADPGGSSAGSGVAVAANLCAASIGTETSGSILNPAAMNAVVGVKPTVGLISRSGIVPISNSQDTAGPMARTVRDAAVLLSVLAGEDSEDPATLATAALRPSSYESGLRADSLQGKRIGVPRNGFYGEISKEQHGLMEKALHALREGGAEIIDPADIETVDQIDQYDVLIYEFKACMNAYLARLGPNAPMRTLEEIVRFNDANADRTLKYGQSLLVRCQNETSGSLKEAEYLRARLEDIRLAAVEGLDRTMRKDGLDALAFPSFFGCAVAAKAGYPSVSVPAGFTSDGLPFAITFTAGAFSEALLLNLAYAYERRTKQRKPPQWP